jgi:AcrR family transcriptional regulator
MERDRQRTEQHLIDAVSSVVSEQGFSALGVNAVASRAGVAKMLIYRYFGSFNGLLEAWALKHSYWAEQSAALSRGELAGLSSREQVKELFRRQIRSLREDPLRREVLRWILTEDHPVAKTVMQRVEEQGHAMNDYFTRLLAPEEDTEAHIALLIAGIYYLALISDRSELFNGLPLNEEEGWSRIEKAVDRLLETLIGGHG